MNVKDSEIKTLLETYKQITVLGLSDNPSKPSFYVPDYMRNQGWSIVGVYPKPHSAGGFKIYQSLEDTDPSERKFVQVFRASDKIPGLVEEILKLGGVEFLWLQLGIEHPEAEAKAEKAGIRVVSNRCLLVEHKRLF